MLLKEEGSNIWILPSDRYSEERDWMFTVQADNGTPSIKFMNPEGYRVIKNEILKFKLNQPFNMEFTLTNRASVALKGEIKAVWHRTFTGEFENISGNDGNTWEDEIGRISIDLPSTTDEYKGKVPCTISTYRVDVKKWVPSVSFYYKAEGSNTWFLMRSDGDSELQRWKGVDIDKNKLINGSYKNPDPNTTWTCLGGEQL